MAVRRGVTRENSLNGRKKKNTEMGKVRVD